MQGLTPVLRRRFFRKLTAACALVVVVAVGLTLLLTLLPLERILTADTERALEEQCRDLEGPAARVLRGELGVAQFLAGHAPVPPTRLTLIQAGGEVIADSRGDGSKLPNLGERPEIVAARTLGDAVERGRGAGLPGSWLYVAHAVRGEGGETLGVVRLAFPLAAIAQEAAGLRHPLILGAGMASLLALLLGLWLSRRLARPVEELARAAGDLREGHYATPIAGDADGELGRIGRALSRLGEEMAGHVQELSGEEARLRAMLAGMVEGVLSIDESGVIVFSNEAARRLLGVPRLDGRRLWEAVRIAELDGLLREARGTDEAARRELVFADEAGREVVLRAHGHRYRSEGQIGVVIVLHDITEVRRLERIRRDFVANVSHELKTPLTAIRGYVETLADGAIDDPEYSSRFLERIETNVGRLSHLVADLLSLARIEEQEDGLRVAPVDLVPLIRQELASHGELAAGKGITVHSDFEGASMSVQGNTEALVQVLDNLIDNAIKYTGNGGRIDVRLSREKDAVVLEVQDTGVGIPSEDLDRIFERFYRVDKARSREVGGTGLGLSIVKHLVGAMKGELEVESEYQQGSIFRVRLPAA